MEMNELRRARESRERDQDGRLTLPDFQTCCVLQHGDGTGTQVSGEQGPRISPTIYCDPAAAGWDRTDLSPSGAETTASLKGKEPTLTPTGHST